MLSCLIDGYFWVRLAEISVGQPFERIFHRTWRSGSIQSSVAVVLFLLSHCLFDGHSFALSPIFDCYITEKQPAADHGDRRCPKEELTKWLIENDEHQNDRQENPSTQCHAFFFLPGLTPARTFRAFSISRALQSRTLTLPTSTTGGGLIVPAAMCRWSVTSVRPNFWAASRVEHFAFIHRLISHFSGIRNRRHPLARESNPPKKNYRP